MPIDLYYFFNVTLYQQNSKTMKKLKAFLLLLFAAILFNTLVWLPLLIFNP